VNIQFDHFSGEDEAVTEIKEAGFWPLTLEFQPEKNEDHWHDFDSMVFILDGTLSVTETESGETCTCGAGTRILAKAGLLHREDTPGYRAVIGFSVDPATLTQPINKPAENR
jgi:hypothetical protein